MMGLSILIISGLCISMMLAAVVAVLVVWMQNRQESAANPDHTHVSDLLPLPGTGSSNPPSFETIHSAEAAGLEAKARALVLAGKKLEAIKVYREVTGVGLAEAKNAVEALERGEPIDIAPAHRPPVNAGDTEARIRAELAAGRKIEAIKIHRAAFGSSLHGAKEAVEEIEREMKA